MIVNVNPRGLSFKGVADYLMHDKKAQTSERVDWSETRNLHTDNIENASKVMAYTDMHADSLKQSFGGSAAGSKREAGAVYHFSLSEDPKNQPTQAQWAGYVEHNIKTLGLEEHQYYMVAHNDQEHAHVHVVVNLVHPTTGIVNSLHKDYKKMDRLAHEYELKNGIVCEDRNKKYQAWEENKKAFKEKENREEYSKKVTSAFAQSDNAKSFKNALENEGLTLSQGNRRGFVLVDTQGEVFAINRLIKFEGDIKRKDKNLQIIAKLEGIDKAALPIANKLQEQRQSYDRDAQELKQQKALAKAAEDGAEKKAKEQEAQVKNAAKIKARAAALDVEKKKNKDKENKLAKQQKIARYEQYLAGKIKASRAKWDIDALIKIRDQAKEELQNNSGFIARLRGKKRAAADKLDAQEKTLGERLERLETDIVYYNKNRPQWVIDRELKKQGIAPQKIVVKSADKAEQEQKTNVSFKDQLLSKEDIAKNVDRQKAQFSENKKSSSLMEGLSAEHREKVDNYKREQLDKKDDTLNEKQSQKHDQGHKPELE